MDTFNFKKSKLTEALSNLRVLEYEHKKQLSLAHPGWCLHIGCPCIAKAFGSGLCVRHADQQRARIETARAIRYSLYGKPPEPAPQL